MNSPFNNPFKVDDAVESSAGDVEVPTFADDITTVARSVEGGQVLLGVVYSFCLWAKLILRFPKCMAVAFGRKDVCGVPKPVWSSFDPKLVVGELPIPMMGPDGCKYLGRRFDPSLF